MELGENWKLKLPFLGASEMAQWEKVLAADPDPLSLVIPETHTVEGKNSFWQVVL